MSVGHNEQQQHPEMIGQRTVWVTSSIALAARVTESGGYCLGSRTSHWSRRARARCNLVVQDDKQAARSRYMLATDEDGALFIEDIEEVELQMKLRRQ